MNTAQTPMLALKNKAVFENELKHMQTCYDAKISVEIVGIRPFGQNVDEALLEKITQRAQDICQKHSGLVNIPMSMGNSAICVGTY